MKFRLVLFKGLFGLNENNILITPNGKYNIKLPKLLSNLLHTIINKFGYVGRMNNMINLNPFRIR